MPKTNTIVQSSTNYKQFKLIGANRIVSKGHVEALKKAFEEIGNLTATQPILVNEKMEIIDGQHRYMACKELGEPIYFTQQPGLGLSDAIKMNILHRSWTIGDYAHAYAESGDPNYRRFVELADDYNFGFSTLLTYVAGNTQGGIFKGFRDGEFVLRDMAATRARLDKFSEIADIMGNREKNFAYAYLKVMQVPGFDQRRMVRKVEQVGDQILRHFSNITDYQRALEEVYNYAYSDANRLRLY